MPSRRNFLLSSLERFIIVFNLLGPSDSKSQEKHVQGGFHGRIGDG
jgi:hypothetical protein